MAITCSVIGCTVRSHDRRGRKNHNGLSFYCFPAWKQNQGSLVSEVTKRRQMAWIAAVRRKDIKFANISKCLRVCSRHFQSGKPAYEMDELNPDWAPSLHLGHSEVRKPRRRQKTPLTGLPEEVGEECGDQAEATEAVMGEKAEEAEDADYRESPERALSAEGCPPPTTWERATAEALLSLKAHGVTPTTAETAQIIIASLKEENNALRQQTADLRSQLQAAQQKHEQEVQALHERLEAVQQRCSCAAKSDDTDSASAFSESDATFITTDGYSVKIEEVVVDIKTEPV